MEEELKGKVALITGCGNPTGIGMSCARTFIREGADVAITSTSERMHQRVNELSGTEAFGFVADLTQRDQAKALADAVLERYGQIDILINNAGMLNVGLENFEFKTFLEIDPETWDLEVSMNLVTAFNVTHFVAPGMVDGGWGRIVMISSVTGTAVTSPGSTGYGAGKAGMEGLMLGLALELAPAGITSNAVAPGWIATSPAARMRSTMERRRPSDDRVRQEVAEVVAFLSSERASYITGQSIVVDGGNMIQEIKR